MAGSRLIPLADGMEPMNTNTCNRDITSLRDFHLIIIDQHTSIHQTPVLYTFGYWVCVDGREYFKFQR